MTKKATAHVQQTDEEQDFITAEEYEQQTVARRSCRSRSPTPAHAQASRSTRASSRRARAGATATATSTWSSTSSGTPSPTSSTASRPTWSHAVRGIVQIGDMVAVTAAITIDGVTREGVGTGNADNETGIKKAEHDALKRAAIKFGIARELYQRESEVIEREGAGPQPGDFPRDPLAKSMADLVTPKQLGMIRALAREAGVDADEECQQVMRVPHRGAVEARRFELHRPPQGLAERSRPSRCAARAKRADGRWAVSICEANCSTLTASKSTAAAHGSLRAARG